MKNRLKLVKCGIVFCLIVVVVTLNYKKLENWRFGEYVCKYSREVQRRTAYTGYGLAKKHLTIAKQAEYEVRLKNLEDDYQQPFQTALSVASDPDFMNKDIDSFDEVLGDIEQEFPREESPGKEIWKLWQAQSEIGIIAWPFVLEDTNFPREDGSSRAISYEEYLTWKKRFDPAHKQVETLLATYE